MDWDKTKENFINKMNAPKDISFESDEEFYFILGQFLIYTFHSLGGIKRFNKEFNYFTNSYIPHSIEKTGLRIIKFIRNIIEQKSIEALYFTDVSNALIVNSSIYINNNINKQNCSDAFYASLHSSNLFIK